jgi:two-component system KDP operon response regulator KdpE
VATKGKMTRDQPIALVIDDEIQIRRFLRAGFELESFCVREAASAGDGLEAAATLIRTSNY